MSLTPDQRRDFMDTLKRYMISDIDKAINANANYLAALGLSSYTENLGGLYADNFNHSGNRYINFIR
jgi:hypothetical protein